MSPSKVGYFSSSKSECNSPLPKFKSNPVAMPSVMLMQTNKPVIQLKGKLMK